MSRGVARRSRLIAIASAVAALSAAPVSARITGRVIFSTLSGAESARIWAIPAMGGRSRSLGRVNSQAPAVASDGRTVVFVPPLSTPGLIVGELRGGGLTALRSVTLPPGWMFASPAWSIDRKRLAFVRDVPVPGSVTDDFTTELYTVRLDGTGLRDLGPGRDPSWSADGTQIIAMVNDVRGSCLAVIGADGSHRRVLACGDFATPSWSLDGRSIAYARPTATAYFHCVGFNGPSSNRTCSKTTDHHGDPDTGSDVYVIGVNGRRARRLTRDHPINEHQAAQPPQRCALRRHGARHPVWSPDGTRIAFAGDDGIHIVDVGGGNDQRITSCPTDAIVSTMAWQRARR